MTINDERLQKTIISLTEQIREFNKKHFNNFYDLRKTNVVGNCATKIEIICPTHGKFEKRINHFLAGSGCKKCLDTNKQISYGDWCNRAHKIHDNKFDYSLIDSTEFKYTRTKGDIICPTHGVFNQSLKNHITGKKVGCPLCAKEERQKNIHPKQYHLSKDTLSLLEDKKWLTEQNHKNNKTLSDIASELGTTVSTIWSRFNKFNIPTKHFFVSSGEQEIIEFINSLGVYDIEQSNRQLIYPYEIDIYLPKFNIAIEFNGDFWHTELNGKDRNYHQRKTNLCKDKNIRLIHITEYEWNCKKPIVQSRLKYLLGKQYTIYARHTHVTEISAKIKKEFLNVNHLYGDSRSSYNIGLYYGDELVQVATFKISRFDKTYDFELIRLCSKIGCCVVGGASKLIRHFVKNHTNVSIVSYADKKWSSGGVYEKIGFVWVGDTPPNYNYVKPPDFTPLPRQRFQKHMLKNMFKNFDPNLTEWENMKLNGYDRTWNAGNAKWVLMSS